MKSTMQTSPLTVTSLLTRGTQLFGNSEVITWQGESADHATYTEVAAGAGRLANVLRGMGVGEGDRVATLAWNNRAHMEAYLAIPCMGAVLHTLNLRLTPQQLVHIVNDAQDRVVIVDASLVPLLAAIRQQLRTVERVIVVGKADTSALGDHVSYEEAVAAAPVEFAWPDLDEWSAAAMCYTTGTTGDPKGVVYSHRSIWLHCLAVWASFRIDESERLLMIVPMFHVNAWGIPYAAWMLGCTLLLPDRFLQAQPLCDFVKAERPTFTGGVPTIFTGMLAQAEATDADLSSIKRAICGGSAVPRALIEAFRDKLNIELIQAWGMTETSPLGCIAFPPAGIPEDEEIEWRSKTGRAMPGVELRIVGDDGAELPWDGTSVGELEARGPWITASYYGVEAPERFHDGWLRTGDVGVMDSRGYLQITDRSKDVIKSGGEWISSVELENHLAAHPAVADAAVVGVHDDRWEERPLAAVVLKPGAEAGADDLRSFLDGKVAHWWLPERWTFVDELPKTSVGKQDKKLIRQLYNDGKLEVTQAGRAAR
ncbi:MAG: long-chain fatty acid--CoA ligase [Candidatus Dormibacteria bacterium]